VEGLTALYPNLGIIHRVSPPSWIASGAEGVTFWVPTHAPHSSHLPWKCIYLSFAPCTWFSPGRGPLMGRICPRVSRRWHGYFTNRLPPTGTRTMALKPPFSSLYYCSEVLRPFAVSPPTRSFLPMGIGGWHRRCLNFGDAYTR